MVNALIISYLSSLFIYPLDKPFKGFDCVGRSPRERGVVRLAPTAPFIPCRMVRNDNIFSPYNMSLLWLMKMAVKVLGLQEIV